MQEISLTNLCYRPLILSLFNVDNLKLLHLISLYKHKQKHHGGGKVVAPVRHPRRKVPKHHLCKVSRHTECKGTAMMFYPHFLLDSHLEDLNQSTEGVLSNLYKK